MIAERITCTRRLTFCAGHRVNRHESKCAHLHGHNYVVEVTAWASQLDDRGRVIDFGVLKEKLGTWLDQNWDHGFLLANDDPWLKTLSIGQDQQKLYKLPYNPTAENIAHYLLYIVCPKMFCHCGVIITRINIHETENCQADCQFEKFSEIQEIYDDAKRTQQEQNGVSGLSPAQTRPGYQ